MKRIGAICTNAAIVASSHVPPFQSLLRLFVRPAPPAGRFYTEAELRAEIEAAVDAERERHEPYPIEGE